MNEREAGSVVVTGGATSVGLATARHFRGLGRVVHLCDIDGDALAALDPSDFGGLAARVDVTDPGAVEGFLTGVLDHGPVDVLVNTVGIGGPRGAIESLSLEAFEATLAGSIRSSFLTIRGLVPQFKARGHGVIVNFSSSSTRTGLPNRTPYVVAKAGVEAMTRNLARELGPHGIRINALLPGAIDNPRLARLIADGARERDTTPEAFERHLLRFISMRAKVGADEIAATVAFLASAAAAHITGQLIGIDGNAEWEE